jgi:hypothetical protein
MMNMKEESNIEQYERKKNEGKEKEEEHKCIFIII